jgi:hypothetical protein
MSKIDFSSPQTKKISMAIPVFIYGCTEDGDPFQELTSTSVVDVGGGRIELESPVVIGLRVLAVNENTDEDIECSVVVSKKTNNGKTEVRIAFDKPSPNFWGIEFASEKWNVEQSKNAGAHQFINGGTDPVTPEMYRRLMGRIH